MDGTDPSPQDVTTQNDLFANHKVKVFAYNQQVTDALTKSFLEASKKAGIPVVGVYETMPTPGYNYQSWMLAEVAALAESRRRQSVHRDAGEGTLSAVLARRRGSRGPSGERLAFRPRHPEGYRLRAERRANSAG